MAEIWMICKPDLEYRIGAYAYETDMDKAYVHKLADKVAEKQVQNNCERTLGGKRNAKIGIDHKSDDGSYNRKL